MSRLCIADLFCGAGGTSSGALEAARALGYQPELTAVNHWPLAIETHTANHPEARHVCTNVDDVNPRSLYRPGELDLLWASPECIYHSNARGDKPINEQSRATAWCVPRWAEAMMPPVILVENVPEFLNWGPIDARGRRIKAKKGEVFKAWANTFVALGYRVDWRVLCCADFGDPTTRRRFFFQAVRGKRKVVWPNPTHTTTAKFFLGCGLSRWTAARQVIDWTVPGKSIFGRKIPLVPNTMRRIIAGLRKFGGPGLEPFIVMLNGTTAQQTAASVRSVDEPLSTITGGGTNHYLAEPFLIGQQSDAMPRNVSDPAPTVATAGAISLVQPFILPQEGFFRGNAPRSTDQPLLTITASHGGGALVEPFLVEFHGSHEGRDDGDHRVKPLDIPLPTQTCDGRFALAQPFIVTVTHANESILCRDVESPLPTITCSKGGEHGLVQPHITKFYGTGRAQSIEQPLDTVTTKDRFGLVEPILRSWEPGKDGHNLPTIRTADGQTLSLDVHFRMLQPRELAGAMSFPATYKFSGNREHQVAQIGNAVPRRTARALVAATLTQNPDVAWLDESPARPPSRKR